MKTLKKLFGIKTTYAISSDSGVYITKRKKYELKLKGGFLFIKDDANCEIHINKKNCKHINSGWQIITK